MKTYQMRLYECDGHTFNNESAQLTDIIEFTLTNPQPANVFGILSQWEEQGKALDAAEPAKLQLIDWAERFPNESALQIAIRQSTVCTCGKAKEIGAKTCGHEVKA